MNLLLLLRSKKLRPLHRLGLGPELEAGQLRAETLVRAFYAFLAFSAFTWISSANKQLRDAPLSARMHLDWASLVPESLWGSSLVVSSLMTFILAALLVVAPQLRSARIAVALLSITYWAICFDVRGKIDHGLHLSFWTALVLGLLPQRPKSAASLGSVEERVRRDYSLHYLRVFYLAQLWIGLLYSCAGVSKLLGVLYDLGEGATWFHPDAMGLILSEHWSQAKGAPLAAFFVLHPGAGWLGNVSALALELLALPVILHGRLTRLWGLGLVGLHLMILETMNIHFHQSVIVLLLFLVASPVVLAKTSSAPTISLLPASRRTRIGVMGAMGLYLIVAFSRLQVDRGRFLEDRFPVSAQTMFWRIDDERKNVQHLALLRKKLAPPSLAAQRD